MTQTPSVSPAVNPFAKYFGRWVAVNVDDTVGKEENFITVTGKVTDISPTAMAVRGNNKIVIVEFKKIIGDVEVQSGVTKARVQRRKLLDPGQNVRKHLVDRHGQKLDVVNALTEGAAKTFHDHLDHEPLAHRHDGEPDRHEADPKQPKAIRQRRVDDSDRPIRQHLADRHGMNVKTLNAMPDTLISQYHAGINHDTLAHRHDDKPAGVKHVPSPRTPADDLPLAASSGIDWINSVHPILPFPSV